MLSDLSPSHLRALELARRGRMLISCPDRPGIVAAVSRFWFEHGASLDAALEAIGPDNLLYETDFPHPTSMSPGPASTALPPKQFIADKLGHLPADVLRKVLHDNAAKLYGLK